MMNKRGQTLVEFALIILLLLAILFGITEFGRAWYHSNALINGVRGGARFASTLRNLSTSGSVTDSVKAYTFSQISSAIPVTHNSGTPGYLLINVSTYQAPPNDNTPGSPKNGGSVKVIARENFNILTGSIIPFFSGPRTLVRQTTMRYQGQ